MGCGGWNYPDWRGPVYYDAPSRKWLELYAERFDTVEVNSTFYRLPAKWAVRRVHPAGVCERLELCGAGKGGAVLVAVGRAGVEVADDDRCGVGVSSREIQQASPRKPAFGRRRSRPWVARGRRAAEIRG